MVFPLVKPSQILRADEITSLEAMIQEVIRKEDLGKAAQLANSVLQIVTKETRMNLEEKIKVNYSCCSIMISLRIQVFAHTCVNVLWY